MALHRSTVIAVLPWMMLLAGPTGVDAQSFQVKGFTLHQIQERGTNAVLPGVSGSTATNTFSMDVDGCKFRIRVASAKTGWSYETTFDDALYKLTTMVSPTNVAYQGAVDTGPIPRDDGTTQNCLWLAYGSACYFSKLRTNRLEPIWLLDDPKLRNEGFAMQAEWTTNSTQPFLPREVTYLSDGLHRYQTIPTDNSIAESKTFRYPPPFEKGFTNAQYLVSQTTNLDGLAIPLKAEFTRYYIDGNRLFVRTLTEITATSVQRGISTKTFRPQFEGEALIVDRRFESDKEATRMRPYFITNGIWKPSGESAPTLK